MIGSHRKSLGLIPFVLGALAFLAMGCASIAVNVPDSATPTIAFTSDGLATRPPPTSADSQSDGLATRAPATSAASQTAATATKTRPPATKRAPTPTRVTVKGYQTVALEDLPPEAQTTMQLILQGGPFPYRQDGVVFQNREGLLPKQKQGYYHEYTVVTPGSSDRGARRIIAGKPGEYYYTDDHYNSFKVILVNE